MTDKIIQLYRLVVKLIRFRDILVNKILINLATNHASLVKKIPCICCIFEIIVVDT